MAAFRTRFLVLALVLAALVGASGTLQAQGFHPGVNASLSCTAFAVPAQSRAEGIAELLGDVIVQCRLADNNTTGFPPSINANIAVTLNVNVTNNIDFSPYTSLDIVTDAVLVVNEVFDGSPITPTADPTLSACCANTQKPMYGRRTAVNTLQWNGAILPVPVVSGNPATLVLRVTNMRGNVSQLGIPSGEGIFPSAQVTAFISVSSSTAVPVTNNVLNIGIPLLGLIARFRGIDQADVTLPIVALQCVTQFVDSDGNIDRNFPTGTDFPHLGAKDDGAFSVRLSEGYASAFKTLGVSTVTPASAQVERGFPTPSSNCISVAVSDLDPGGCGGATQGTRFIIRFYNVPNGVRIATASRLVGTIGDGYLADTPGHALVLIKVAGTDANGAGLLNSSLSPSSEVTITGGFGYVIYEVVNDNPFAVENVIVPIWVGYRANTANDLPQVGTLQASAAFAPLSTVTTSNNSAPEPRFVDTGANRSMYTIARCTTNLLFPFVTNQGGFDTGIAISNTTRDDKGTTAQAGACSIYYFGSTTGGGAAPPQQTSNIVPSGAQLVFTLSGGNASQSIAATPGFQGYMMALCQFQYAHGFAFITDGFGGVPSIAEGYLALVVPWDGEAGSRAAGTGESLGH
jgi:hypothetical protein